MRILPAVSGWRSPRRTRDALPSPHLGSTRARLSGAGGAQLTVPVRAFFQRFRLFGRGSLWRGPLAR
jgi:hypothetical protein